VVFFYARRRPPDKNGGKVDAPWHDEILNGIDPAAEYRHRLESSCACVVEGLMSPADAIVSGPGLRPERKQAQPVREQRADGISRLAAPM
jgi:hypothetical protein